MISNCGKDERGKYTGGQAGDQTGKEYTVISWYNRPWSVILRYPNKDVAREIAMLAREAANNELIGYDQGNRLSFYNNLKVLPSWNPADIMVECEADCSSSTAAILIAVGHRMNIRKLRDLSPSLTTRNMRKALVAAGFSALADGVYTGSERYLLPGDVLLSEGHHVAVNLDKGNGNPDYETVAKEVIDGLWGSGAARKTALMAAGWPYAEVQAEVNLLMWGK